MRIKDLGKMIFSFILTLFILTLISCGASDIDSADDITITVDIPAEDVFNVQVYTVNDWKYVEDGLSVTVEKNFQMKFIQVEDDEVRYYYYSNLIATAEGYEFTIEDSDGDSDDTSVQVWRSSRSEAFEVDYSTLDYYKITFEDDVTDLGTITYESPYIEITDTDRVDYNEDQSAYLEYDIETYDSDEENYFGNWDFSDDSTPVLNEYTGIEIYVAGNTYTVTSGALEIGTTSAIELDDLIEN